MSESGISDRIGLDWELSERKYEVVVERDVEVAVDGGDITLVADVFRPDTDESVPTIGRWARVSRLEPDQAHSRRWIETPEAGSIRYDAASRSGNRSAYRDSSSVAIDAARSASATATAAPPHPAPVRRAP